MNFEQMEYIVYVANEQSVTKAAEKLFISPSGMSQSITQLENELGIKIFNRSKQGVTPTYEGNIVISKAIHLLKTINELNNEIYDFKNTNEKHMKILTAPAFSYILQETMVNFKNKDVTYEVVEENPANIIQNFNKNNFNFAFVAATKDELQKEKNICFEYLTKGHYCIAVGKKSPFYSLDFVTPKDLVQTKIVMYKNSDYKKLQKITKMNPKNVILTSNRSGLLLELVKESKAVLYLYDFSIKKRPIVLSEDIKVIPIKVDHFIEVDFWIIYLESKGLTPLAQEFINEFKNYLN
ncbi:LysR family transcriptional regulator [Bacillus sp. JJ664]